MSGTYRIYDYMEHYDDDEEFPGDVDFKTCSKWWTPHKVTYPLLQGEPTHVIYYEDHTKTKEVCRIDFTIHRYHRDNPGEEGLHGFIKQRIALLRWYKHDGSLSEESKDLGRYFLFPDDLQLMLDEGIQKRNLIFQNLKANVLGMLQATLAATHTPDEAKLVGVNFVASKSLEFTNYVGEYNRDIIDSIQNNTADTWLDNVINAQGVTIRQYMIGELDLG